jgi:hypothetical protein
MVAVLIGVASALGGWLPASVGAQELGDVPGPGQAVEQPAAQCAQTVACTYSERNFLPAGYRVQSLEVCGANCTLQYWVSRAEDGQALVEVPPARGGAVVAIDGAGTIRVVQASYAPTDAACCPSGFADTTYTWDDAAGAMVPHDPLVTPASDFPGWEAVRQALQGEGWVVS